MAKQITTTVSVAKLVLLAAAALPHLDAATIQAWFVEDLYSSGIQRTVGDAAGWVDTTIGLFHFQRTGGDYLGFQVSDFYSFCIEPREFVSPGSTYTYEWTALENGTTNIGGMGTTKANLIRELFGRFHTSMWDPFDGTTAGAFQIAIWEIVRETSGTLDVGNGTTQFRNAQNPAALTQAQNYLSALNGNGPKVDDLFAGASGTLTVPGVQDILFQPVSEPAGLGALGIALLAVAHFRRYRR